MIEATIPMPIQIVLDDVGWWRSDNGSQFGEPYRTGLGRAHVPADYEAIASLGRQLDMRPQAAMILCEWDRENILRDVPSATWMGRDWDNSRLVGPWLDEATQVIRDNATHFEFVLHGVGHEYWDENGKPTRAEWFHSADGRMRPHDEVLTHLDAYRRIMAQNDLGPFPESFVPAAFCYRFGMGEDGLAAILRDHGVRYISTPFAGMRDADKTQRPLYGFECDTMNVDRGHATFPWFANDCAPTEAQDEPIVGLHWPNILHFDPKRNEEVVARWVAHLGKCNQRIDRTLAPDTADCWSQLVYYDLARLDIDGTQLALDFSRADAFYFAGIKATFVLKVKAPAGAALQSDALEVASTRYDADTGLHTWRVQRIHPDEPTAHATLALPA